MSSLIQRSGNFKPKKGGDETYEWEKHMILRVPKEIAADIDDFIENGEQYDPQISNAEHKSSQMAIKFLPNMQCGELKIKGKELGFTIQDLPCIVETYQTHDKKNIYKVADISKIINCTTSTSTTTTTPEVPDLAPGHDENKNEIEILEPIVQREKLIRYPHGITAPMKNARKRIFRKTRKMKYTVAPLVEQELKRLLRLDLDASSIKWEIIEDVDLAAPSSTIHLDHHHPSSPSHTIEDASNAINDSEALL